MSTALRHRGRKPTTAASMPWAAQALTVGRSYPANLPAGLRLGDDGVVTGTPLNSGPALFRVRVQDARGQTAAVPCSLTINSGTFGITSCPLPDGFSGELYSQQINATGGVEPYIFSTVANPPTGLNLSPAGKLSGRLPAGNYPITLRVNDAGGRTSTRACQSQRPPSGPASYGSVSATRCHAEPDL